jgi:Zn finger protein HypA/HybF involved in hydrogenase expression
VSEIRLPLQVGTSAFWGLLRSAVYFLPSAVIFLGVLIPGIVIIVEVPDLLSVSDTLGQIIIGIFVALLALPFIFLRSAIRQFVDAWEERPSDIVLRDGSKVLVVGGPYNGRTFEGNQCKLQDTHHKRSLANEEIEIVELSLENEVVARAARDVEKESLRALHETLVARSQSHDTKPVHEAAVSLLSCTQCDAPVIPDDAEQVTCPYCKAKVVVPTALREKIRAQRTLAADRPRNERMIEHMLRQPSARFVWSVMLGLGAPMLLVWPAAVFAMFHLYRHDGLAFANVALLLLAGVVAIAALFVLMRWTLVNRQALSLVSARFSALPPDKPGAPRLCRTCRAPLPDAGGDRMVVKCAYCESDNVLGFDLRIPASIESKQRRSLDDELARRRSERFRWRASALGAVAILALLRWGVPFACAPHSDPARCRAGDAAACLSAGKHREADGKLYDEDIREVFELYHLGCAAKNTQSCREAARVAYSWGNSAFEGYVDTVPDLRTGCELGDGHACGIASARIDEKLHPHDFLELNQRGCQLGYLPCCSDIGYAYENGIGVAKDNAHALLQYRQACARNYPLACANAALQLEHAQPPNLTEAQALFDRACPLGVKHDDDDAACTMTNAFYQRRCTAGDPVACARTGGQGSAQ